MNRHSGNVVPSSPRTNGSPELSWAFSSNPRRSRDSYHFNRTRWKARELLPTARMSMLLSAAISPGAFEHFQRFEQQMQKKNIERFSEKYRYEMPSRFVTFSKFKELQSVIVSFWTHKKGEIGPLFAKKGKD